MMHCATYPFLLVRSMPGAFQAEVLAQLFGLSPDAVLVSIVIQLEAYPCRPHATASHPRTLPTCLSSPAVNVILPAGAYASFPTKSDLPALHRASVQWQNQEEPTKASLTNKSKKHWPSTLETDVRTRPADPASQGLCNGALPGNRVWS
ncbi:hypothetical protein BC567DRAFT_64244 [Phyllosticta citribraziliensis]